MSKWAIPLECMYCKAIKIHFATKPKSSQSYVYFPPIECHSDSDNLLSFHKAYIRGKGKAYFYPGKQKLYWQ